MRVGGVFLLLGEAAVACWRRISTVIGRISCVLEEAAVVSWRRISTVSRGGMSGVLAEASGVSAQAHRSLV